MGDLRMYGELASWFHLVTHRIYAHPLAAGERHEFDVLAAFDAAGGSVLDAADVRIRPSTVKRHLADMRGRSRLTTEQPIYTGRASGQLVVPSLEPD